ncbi:unnamed protein product [Didymodactylos carnosus]|uniref:Uncharacterized protein n=1 Tax=Didymodactylos carnosus TaxID=1234261 RepID=A0A8S2E1R9_9BILA|nr:unnamed protein product [Didymodactylos carnosus]CAF3830081.1 unnamed protein product [Didymodactylos carnosus]
MYFSSPSRLLEAKSETQFMNGEEEYEEMESSLDREISTEKILPDHLDITKLTEEQQKDPVILEKIKEVAKDPNKHPYILEMAYFTSR